MNWVWFVVVIILVGCTLNGRKNGLVKTVFALFSSIIALALTTMLAPAVSNALQSNEKLYQYIEEKVEQSLCNAEIEEANEESTASQINAINQLPLPGALRDKLVENKNIEVYKAMAVNSLQEYIVKYMTGVVINAGSFIGLFLIISLALFILSNVLDLISKLPVLNGLNKTTGAVAGLIKGLIVIWILCIILTIFSSTAFAKEVYVQINDSTLLSYLYNHNLLLRVIADVFRVLQ